MTEEFVNQLTITKILDDDYIDLWIKPFLIDRYERGLSKNTINFYKAELKLFLTFCETEAIKKFSQLTPHEIRVFILWLEQSGHNPGGRHAAYRSLKVFIRWWIDEMEPEGFKNPFEKVKAPKVRNEPLEPVTILEVEKLLLTCQEIEFFGLRDTAIFLFLLDTGARATETTMVRLNEIDLRTGSVLIRCGKGGKSRTVFLGKKTRKAIRSYIREAKDYFDSDDSPLFINKSGEGLTYWGLNEIIKRRSSEAGIEKLKLHGFRRAFAVNALRSGMDMETLRRLLGHADYQCLQRYLREVTDDLRRSHHQHSPVDNNL